MRRDRRATSTALGYVLSLGIAGILVSGLIVAGGGLVEDQRDQSARIELQVIGQTVADDLASAGRLADCDSCTVRLRIDVPSRVAGDAYRIRIVEVDPPTVHRLVLTTGRSDAAANVTVRTRRPVAETTVTGGTLIVEYDPASGALEVRND
ncbi:hypothetical protein DU504_02530 [Haloplanus salinus]|jgi:hypothetical protein|uniref:Flagellin n=1 Tax=Haloplanus salinus TaxID=1126245 RepID=A0A368N7V3_9EURY|nr:hypothetical protein [Haloplanus salinus]RCU46276.1 hypothetical protein DU504_02530 [Haloplanus salinus]